ncbi:MAG: 50S ribosomal protein L6, partial [Patescibacteria group bacterium]
DSYVSVKGPKGELKQSVPLHVKCVIEAQTVQISVSNPDVKDQRALWGLMRALVANMIKGVTDGFEKKLEINGIGFKAAVQGQSITLNLGFSHPVIFKLPDGVTAKVEKNVIIISGIDKQLVGETAATIRRLKPPEPYKGKGIKYADEIVRRKAGKVVKAAGG